MTSITLEEAHRLGRRQIPNEAFGLKRSPHGRGGIAYLLRQGIEEHTRVSLHMALEAGTPTFELGDSTGAYVWSPCGLFLACSMPNEIRIYVFWDARTNRPLEEPTLIRTIPFQDLGDDGTHQLFAHPMLYGVTSFAWHPESTAVACTIGFRGGRTADPDPMAGDRELFLIPISGGHRMLCFDQAIELIQWEREGC